MSVVRSAGEKLRDLESITDVALSLMEPEKLLDELLDRVKDILQGDTAAVLLLDQASGQLVATAARGLEEEVRQNVRIPLGRGFAGRVAAEKRPVILGHVDHSNVLNPILMQKGIRSLIGVPMLESGKVIGVLHVGTLRTRKFTDEDASLLLLAADRATAAVQSVTGRADRAAAAALQRSLVPPALPRVAGWAVAGNHAVPVYRRADRAARPAAGRRAGDARLSRARRARRRGLHRGHGAMTSGPVTDDVALLVLTRAD